MKANIDVRKFTGYLSIFLSSVYFVVAGLAIAFFKGKADFVFEKTMIITYWTFVLSLMVFYFVDSVEKQDEKLSGALSREFPGIKVFEDSHGFVKELIEVTLGAESVSTLNYSPPKGASKELDEYFLKVHDYLNSKNSPLLNFRSIASIENKHKAAWLLSRAHLFVGNGHVSLGNFSLNSTHSLMCFHVVMKNKIGYVFFYPPIPLTGVMNAFMIINNDVYEVMKRQFDIVWAQCTPLLVGGVANEEGVDQLYKIATDYPPEKIIEIKRHAFPS